MALPNLGLTTAGITDFNGAVLDDINNVWSAVDIDDVNEYVWEDITGNLQAYVIIQSGDPLNGLTLTIVKKNTFVDGAGTVLSASYVGSASPQPWNLLSSIVLSFQSASGSSSNWPRYHWPATITVIPGDVEEDEPPPPPVPPDPTDTTGNATTTVLAKDAPAFAALLPASLRGSLFVSPDNGAYYVSLPSGGTALVLVMLPGDAAPGFATDPPAPVVPFKQLVAPVPFRVMLQPAHPPDVAPFGSEAAGATGGEFASLAAPNMISNNPDSGPPSPGNGQ